MDDTRIASRVATRFAAEMDAKLKDLLAKVRKSATASFNWKNLSDVLAAMGGKVEKVVVAIPLFGDGADISFFADENRDVVERKYAEYKKLMVSSLPSKPKAGQLYVTEITDIKENRGDFEFDVKAYMGNDAWRVTLEDKSETFTPRGYDLGSIHRGYKPKPGAKIPVWDATKWLNTSTTWKAKAAALIDLPEHEPAIPRTRAGTGTCGICFQNVKLKMGGSMPTLVFHGYRRPGTGQTHGSCSAVGEGPFELTVEPTKKHRDNLAEREEQLRAYLKKLESGEITKLRNHRDIEISIDDPNFKNLIENTIYKLKLELNNVESEHLSFERLVMHWKERPLPLEGEPEINWFYKGQKG